jgi:hypothetical protein
MISLRKTFDYSCVVLGVLKTVKVFTKEVAVAYFQSIDSSVIADEVIVMKHAKSSNPYTIEEISASLPTHTNI